MDPCAPVARRSRLEQQRDEGMRLHPGEPARRECSPERPAFRTRPRDSQQRACAAWRHAETLFGVRIQAREAEGPRNPEQDEALELCSEVGEPPRLEAQRAAQARIELEGIGGVEIAREVG